MKIEDNVSESGVGFKLETYGINKNDFTGNPGAEINTFGNFQENMSWFPCRSNDFL